MHLPDCDAHRLRRYSALPMVMLLAERVTSTVAPGSGGGVLGGVGVHTPSQISACSLKPSTLAASKIKSFPKGTRSPRKSTSRLRASRLEENRSEEHTSE